MTFWLTFCLRRGFGVDRGPRREVRCGVVSFGWVKGALMDKLDAALAALRGKGDR